MSAKASIPVKAAGVILVLTVDGVWVSREYSEMESATRLKEATKTHFGQLPDRQAFTASSRMSYFVANFKNMERRNDGSMLLKVS